jgi:hypothetical protein
LRCIAGVTGAILTKSVEAIMDSHSSVGLNAATKAALVAAGIMALAVPIVVGVVNAPAVQAESPAEIASRFATHPSNESHWDQVSATG